MVLLWLALALCGCATSDSKLAASRPFVWPEDTLAYANELKWEYYFDPATGKTTHTQHEPPPTYALHCFAVVRSARQFFDHARFDPARPIADEATYRRLV